MQLSLRKTNAQWLHSLYAHLTKLVLTIKKTQAKVTSPPDTQQERNL